MTECYVKNIYKKIDFPRDKTPLEAKLANKTGLF